MDEPKIIYEDKNFLGVYKPAGMLVHSYKTADGLAGEDTLADWLLGRFPELGKIGDDPEIRPGIVHRLDRGTSGVIIVPRNQEYFEYFKNLFKTRQVKKTYLALVFGEPREKEGIIDKPIGIKNGSVKRSVHSDKMAKSAITRYKVKKTFILGGVPFSLLEVFPETGRTHQIRVHLASIGHPIAGDRLYGAKKKKEGIERLMLHACSVEFSLPNESRIKLEIEPEKPFFAEKQGF